MPVVEASSLRSLFIVSLPRSLSTLVHHVCCTALGLRSPRWTSAGEILNAERLAVRGDGPGTRVTPLSDRFRCEQLFDFLDTAVRPLGYCYKDVVQPFVTADWLGRQSLAVLRIRRPIADVAWSMRQAGWDYPPAAADDRSQRGSPLPSLIRAARALDRVHGEVVDFDALVQGEDALRSALQALYPAIGIPPLPYIDDRFRAYRDEVLARRKDREWESIAQRVKLMEPELSV